MNTIEIGLFIFLLFSEAEGSCNFPSDLRGDWLSADRGVLTFTASTLTNYAIQLSAAVSSVDFECSTLQEDQYYLRGSSTFTVFGTLFRPHICLEFQNITSDKYYYYVATAIERTVNDRIYVDRDSAVVTHSDVCNRQKPYEVGTYVMLIRDGTSDSSLAIRCPGDIQRTFENVNMVTADGATSCSGSRLDTCTDEHLMNYTYNSCSTSLTFSANGLWRCLYYKSSGSTTYLAIWNMDGALITGQTYRIVCYTLQWASSSLQATSYPGSCRANQTHASVVSPGVVLVLSDVSDFTGFVKTRLRRNTKEISNPEDGFDLVPFYVGAVALALLILGIVGVCVSYHHYKNADKPNRVHTIKVKEAENNTRRESTSGIFSCSSTSVEELDFRSTSTPVKPRRIREKIISPPDSLTKILTTQNSKDEFFMLQNKTINRDIYDDIHYTYLGQGHLKKRPNVETAEDFYRNYRMYAAKDETRHSKNYKIAQKSKKPLKKPKMSEVIIADYINPNYYERTKFSERNNINFIEPKRVKRTSERGVEDGPSARGRGDITNTVHYFDRRIPMHWK